MLNWSYRTVYLHHLCATVCWPTLSSPPLCDCLLTNFLRWLCWNPCSDCDFATVFCLRLLNCCCTAAMIVLNWSYRTVSLHQLFTLQYSNSFSIIYPRFCRVLITRPFLWRRILNNGPYLMVLTCALNFGSFIITNPKPHDPSLLNNSQMLTQKVGQQRSHKGGEDKQFDTINWAQSSMLLSSILTVAIV